MQAFFRKPLTPVAINALWIIRTNEVYSAVFQVWLPILRSDVAVHIFPVDTAIQLVISAPFSAGFYQTDVAVPALRLHRAVFRKVLALEHWFAHGQDISKTLVMLTVQRDTRSLLYPTPHRDRNAI